MTNCLYKDCHKYHYPNTIVVQQIIGENEEQKTIDIHIVVPKHKPAIEQVVDVFIKKVRITSVNVLCNKVIVRGDFEVKAIYVACLPNQPVHAVEAKRVRFTADLCIDGARPGMDADASVQVEYVDYACDRRTKAYWYKHTRGYVDNCDCKKYKCTRNFNVFVVLKICAKVLAAREIVICKQLPLPLKPKG